MTRINKSGIFQGKQYAVEYAGNRNRETSFDRLNKKTRRIVGGRTKKNSRSAEDHSVNLNSVLGTSLPSGPTDTPKSTTSPVSMSYTHPWIKIPAVFSFFWLTVEEMVWLRCCGPGGYQNLMRRFMRKLTVEMRLHLEILCTFAFTFSSTRARKAAKRSISPVLIIYIENK